MRDNSLQITKVDSFFITAFAVVPRTADITLVLIVLFEGGITGNLSSVRTVVTRKKWGN